MSIWNVPECSAKTIYEEDGENTRRNIYTKRRCMLLSSVNSERGWWRHCYHFLFQSDFYSRFRCVVYIIPEDFFFWLKHRWRWCTWVWTTHLPTFSFRIFFFFLVLIFISNIEIHLQSNLEFTTTIVTLEFVFQVFDYFPKNLRKLFWRNWYKILHHWKGNTLAMKEMLLLLFDLELNQ